MKFIAIVTIITIAYLLMKYRQMLKNRKLKTELREQFGKKPKIKKNNFEKIEFHWLEYINLIPDEEIIDDITWNDLEMNSLFNRINNCNSFAGEQILFSILHSNPKDKEHLNILEKKVEYFRINEEERIELQMLLHKLGKEDNSYHMPSFMTDLDSYRIIGIWKYRILQILLILSILPSIILWNPVYLIITGGILLINFIVYLISKMKYEVNSQMLDSIISIVNICNKISDTNKFSYESNFNDLSDHVALFKKLSSMISLIKMKKDAAVSGDIIGLLYDYLIGATLWDFVKYDQIITILKDRKKEFMEMYKTLGEVDMAISIASFRESLPHYCIPTFCEDIEMQIVNMYHPLIDNPVCNTSKLRKGSIITGSNASGKSTFIKAIALNTILAQNIHTCMAIEMVVPPSRILTSMAVRDDLMEGESYYIREIKYLKRIIQNLSDDRLVICVIDEILRGTNTDERIAASASILRYVNKRNCMAIVASHDIELTQLLHKTYDNYHFTEQMEEKDIFFDYKLYDGPSTSKNAIKLLKYIGFPDEIISVAMGID